MFRNILKSFSLLTALTLLFFTTPQVQAASCDDLLADSYSIGDRGSDVAELQACLVSTGDFNYPDGPTGYFGPITQASLKNYKTRVLSRDDSSAVCDKLLANSYYIGQRGEAIVSLQDCLTATGHFTFSGGSTGYYGSITHAALTNFNSDNDSKPGADKDTCDVLTAQNWEIGQQGNNVTALQECLITTGHFTLSGGSTGYYGSITQTALNDYKNSLNTNVVSGQSEKVDCDTLTSNSYYIGQQGVEVLDLQNCLIDTGHFTLSGGGTGYYGSITRTALNAYLNPTITVANSATNPTFMWPTDSKSITCVYLCHSGHLGLDIDSRTVTHPPVYASSGGTVIEVLSGCPSRDYSYNCYGAARGYYGNYVVIDHGNGYTTLSSHLNSTSVVVGQQVSQGQIIGYMGNSGYALGMTGIHLHFELSLNGVEQDPLLYI